MDTLSTQDLRDRLPEVISRVRVAGESFLVTQYRRPAFVISPAPDQSRNVTEPSRPVTAGHEVAGEGA